MKPKYNDIYILPTETDQWGMSLYYVRATNDPSVGVFQDNNGELYEVPFHELRRVGLTRNEEAVKADADKRLYQNRSRTTARQRAAKKITPKQRCYLIGLAARQGLSIDDLRAITPDKSISKLTIGEASKMIDRFKGQSRRTGS